MVMEIRLNFQICVQYVEKAISKNNFRGTPEYQRVASQGSEWPDKRDRWPGVCVCGGGDFFA